MDAKSNGSRDKSGIHRFDIFETVKVIFLSVRGFLSQILTREKL